MGIMSINTSRGYYAFTMALISLHILPESKVSILKFVHIISHDLWLLFDTDVSLGKLMSNNNHIYLEVSNGYFPPWWISEH